MNNILAYILEFIGLGKRTWHYTRTTPSQHILDYWARIDPYKIMPLITDSPIKITGLAIVPKDDPSRTGTIEPAGYYKTVDGFEPYYHLGGVVTRPDWEEHYKGHGKSGGDTGER